MSKVTSVVLFTLCACMSAQPVSSYQANTHRTLNSNVVTIGFSAPYLKSYLQNTLGYANIDQTVNGAEIKKWFENAGELEDKPFTRSVNHFHDPIANSGFSGLTVFGLFSGNPAPIWGQLEVGQQSPGGKFSWRDARSYFYMALTYNDKTTRELNLASTFRAVGQVMHLLQDMSVPEHTRDTAHIGSYTIESFVEGIARNPNHPYRTQFNNLLASPVFPDPALLQQIGLLLNSPIPIINLFDAQKYNGTNPAVAVGNNIGLAEYSNANFFSFNTIFKDYPNPVLANVAEAEETDPATGEIKTFVLSPEVGHLAQTTVFYKYLIFGKTKGYTLEDDRIYLDYMEKLLPRAVGYSAALLDYFFRGKIDVQPVPGAVTFRTITVTAQNTTANGEEMPAGEVSLVIRYKELLESGTGPLRTLNFPTDEYKYRVVTLPGLTSAT